MDEWLKSDFDLLRINELFTDTYQFTDIDFIYEERLNEAIEKASKFAESPVDVALVVEVIGVRKQAVDMTFFPREETGKRIRPYAFPQVRFVEDPNAEVQFYSRTTDIGLGGTVISGKQGGHLEVGSVVPVPLAKTLRRGDRLKITGTLIEVKPVGLASFPDRKVAGFVIVASDVERASHDDSEADAQ